MPRQPRLVIPGLPHHVTQRGNYRQKVFDDSRDFKKYSYWMLEYSQKYDVRILAYCLMDNHVHFIVIPTTSFGLAQLFKIVHMQYSLYKNRTQSKTGHLWQGRFYSNVLDETHLLRAIRYVERNPLRAGMVNDLSKYIWSSAREHLGLEKKPIIKTADFDTILHLAYEKNWKDYLEKDDPQMTKNFRRSVLKCAPIGTENFIADLEQEVGYSLKDKKRGRPRKEIRISVCP